MLGPPRPATVLGAAGFVAVFLTILGLIPVANGDPYLVYIKYYAAIAVAATAGFSAATARIEASDDRLFIINLVTCTALGRGSVVGADGLNGVVVRTTGGGEETALAYQASNLLSFLPSRRYRAAARRITRWATGVPMPQPGETSIVRTPRWGVLPIALVALAASQALGALAYLAQPVLREPADALLSLLAD